MVVDFIRIRSVNAIGTPKTSANTYNALGARIQNIQYRINANAGHQNAPLSGGSIYMREDYDPTVDGNGDYWQRVWESIFGTTHQNEYETVIKDYVVDYLSVARRDILVYEAGSYVQRYVYAANGARLSLELSYAEGTQRGDPGQNIASDIAVNDISKIWYHRSLLDSTLFAVDKDGNVVIHAIYDPWGKPLTETNPGINFAGIDNITNYTGYTWDEVLQMYYAQIRFFDADLHRFTQEDPANDGWNWYVYCGNSPTLRVDPTGLFMLGMIMTEGAYGSNYLEMGERLSSLGLLDIFYYTTNYNQATTAGVSGFQQEEGLAVTGNVDWQTWTKLGLALNASLEQEFWSGSRGLARRMVTISGNNITIDYKPKVHIRGTYFEYIYGPCSESPDGQNIVGRRETSGTVSNSVYNNYMHNIKEGIKLWNGTYNIYSVLATVSVNFVPEKVSSRLAADLRVDISSTASSMVPGTWGWSRGVYQIMHLNVGGHSYNNVKSAAGHEFGHVLGVFDAYYYGANPIAARAGRAHSSSIMRNGGRTRVDETEILMMLYAFSRNRLQTYEETWWGGEVSVVFFQ